MESNFSIGDKVKFKNGEDIWIVYEISVRNEHCYCSHISGARIYIEAEYLVKLDHEQNIKE